MTVEAGSTSASRFATGCPPDRGLRGRGARAALRDSSLRVSEDQLRRNARRFHDAFAPRWPGPFRSCCRRSRPTPCLALRRILSDEGTGCDVFGAGELEAALRTGTEPATDLAQRPDEGRGAARARDPVGGTDHARQPGRARAGRRGRRASRRSAPTSACASAPTSSAWTGRRRCRPTGVSIREALQRYKAGIPTEDLLAIDRVRDRRPEPRRRRDHAPPRAPQRGPGDLERRRSTRSLDLLGGCARPGTAGPRASSTRRRLSRRRATRSAAGCRSGRDAPPARPASTSTRRRSAPRWSRGLGGSAIDAAADPARGRAGTGALRRRRRPPRDRRQRQATDRAGAADLGRDRLLGRLPGRRQPRVQPLDLPRRRRRRRRRRRWSPTSPGAPARST